MPSLDVSPMLDALFVPLLSIIVDNDADDVVLCSCAGAAVSSALTSPSSPSFLFMISLRASASAPGKSQKWLRGKSIRRKQSMSVNEY